MTQGTASAVLEFAGIRKSYGSVEALRGVDLHIERGESVAILGPNGAGKTTAISLLLGLRQPTSGRVTLFGRSPMDRVARSRCGAMLQESGVPGRLRVRELVALFRTYYPRPLPIADTLHLAGLEQQSGVMAANLSGGQRQRLYFALAVCGDPDVLFLDEPTVAMDVAARRAFRETILRYRELGRTIVLTTHFMEEADEIARRIVVIDRGLIVADGTAAEIKAKASGKRVQFSVRGDLDARSFAGLPVNTLTIADHRVRFLSSQPERALGELFRRGIGIADLEVVGADLEEAFLALTSSQPVIS